MSPSFHLEPGSCYGEHLQAGDTVTLIKDLYIKGANYTAKHGTAVRRIRKVQEYAEQIEGKVRGATNCNFNEFRKEAFLSFKPFYIVPFKKSTVNRGSSV